MKMYAVFDCTKATGYTVKVPTKFLALIMCDLLGLITRHEHDYTLF